MVRPGQIYKVAVSILQANSPLTVRGSIRRNGVELSSDSQDIKEGIPETLIMRVSKRRIFLSHYLIKVKSVTQKRKIFEAIS